MRLRVFLVGLSILALVGVASAGAGVTAIDDDHPLATDDSIDEFQERGLASSSLTQIDMRVTVAESSADVGLEGVEYTDFDSTYLRIEYREEIPRTVRIYIPREYFRPRPDESLEAADSGRTATLDPVDGRNYTAIRITFTGAETVVFPVSKEAGIVFDGRGGIRDVVSNETGFDVPSIYSSGQWSYVDTTDLEANTTVAIDAEGQELTLQYDDEPAPNASRWLKVPDCGDDSAPVCRFTRSGDDQDRVYLLARSTDVPEVRYKHGNDPLAGLKAALGDATNAIDGLLEQARSILGL